MKSDITITGRGIVISKHASGVICAYHRQHRILKVLAFLGALRSFTQFALLSRRIRRGFAKIDIRALLPRLIKILVISALSLCLPAMAQDQNGWQFDSLSADSTVSKTDAQQIYEVLLKMLHRWNAHDIGGYLEAYWKSPELLVVVDSEQFNGWQQLHDSYINGHPDRNSMGVIDSKRIQVKLLKPDLALALTWWSISFPSSKQKVVGNTTMNLQKFDDGWKIVAAHSCTAEI